MKESIANSYVFTLVLVIVSVCSALIIVSMNYSKVFKMKNRVIEIIEKNGEYNNTNVRDEINAYLRTSGYPPYQTSAIRCPVGRGNEGLTGDGLDKKNLGVEHINVPRNYKYCIYEYKTAKGSYYQVVLYMKFDFPLIGDFMKIEIPMRGDTKIIYDY